MNCDDVFVILTRGPFPTGSHYDDYVEAHLQSCAECQRIAAALRPNDAILQETIGSEESRALPGYWGNSLSRPGETAISLTGTASDRRTQRAGGRLQRLSFSTENLNVWQFMAAVALGIVLAAALRTLVTVHNPSVLAADPGLGALIGHPRALSDADKDYFLAKLDLGPDCRPSTPRPPIVSPLSRIADDAPLNIETGGFVPRQNCCTQCHRVGDGEGRIASKERFQRSCQICHDGRQ